MSERKARILRALFVVYAVATALHIAYVVNREPFAFDAWNVAVDSGARPFTWGRFLEFWWGQYTSSNPRIGQPLAYLAYKVVGFAEVGTTLAYFALVGATFVLGTGRLPSWKRNRDLAALTVAIGFLWFAAPEFASFLFCRAYATNYVWAAAIQLWFVAALRLAMQRHEPELSSWRLVGALMFGVCAGACNEHTGPTLVLFVVGCVWWVWRRGGGWRKDLLASALGALVGFGLLFFAPGQGQRYDGLAQRLSLKDRLLARGLTKNLDIFEDLLYSAGPLLVLLLGAIIIGEVVERRAKATAAAAVEPPELAEEARVTSLQVTGLALVAGVLITATVFFSPKLGTRFYMHAMLLLLAGFLGVLGAFVRDTRNYRWFISLAVVASVYAGASTIPMFSRLHRASEQRLAGLAATPVGGTYTAQGWDEVAGSWWFLGDDFRDPKKLELVSKYYDLRTVVFHTSGVWRNLPPPLKWAHWSALDISNVRLSSTYEFDHDLCLDQQAQVDIKPYIGRDLGAVHLAFRENIDEILHANVARLKSMELAVKFLGEPPPMPPGKLVVARWKDGVFDLPRATIQRVPNSLRRQIVVPPEFLDRSQMVYLVAIGDAPRALGRAPDTEALRYVPWRTGSYWVIICGPTECRLVTTTFHRV